MVLFFRPVWVWINLLVWVTAAVGCLDDGGKRPLAPTAGIPAKTTAPPKVLPGSQADGASVASGSEEEEGDVSPEKGSTGSTIVQGESVVKSESQETSSGVGSFIKTIGEFLPKLTSASGSNENSDSSSSSSALPSSTGSDCSTSKDVEAGPISSNSHAQSVCPTVCQSAGGSWNSNWTTKVAGVQSVCGCKICP